MREGSLGLRARLVLLAEARGEDDHAANAPARASLDGLEHGLRRHDEHQRIHAHRQVVDGRHAGHAIDVGAAAADEMQIPRKAEAPQVHKHIVAD